MWALSTSALLCSVLRPVKLFWAGKEPTKGRETDSRKISEQTNEKTERKTLNYVREHANLVNDVVPLPRRLEFIRQDLVELLAHVDNAMRHRLDIALPLLE